MKINRKSRKQEELMDSRKLVMRLPLPCGSRASFHYIQFIDKDSLGSSEKYKQTRQVHPFKPVSLSPTHRGFFPDE